MKTNFTCDFCTDCLDDFNLNCSNQYDIAQIDHFISNPMPNVPMNNVDRHHHIVETRKRLDIIINAIKDYETKNTENSENCMESN